MLLLYTDGLSECTSAVGDEFGEDRVAAVLRQNREQPAEAIIEAIVNATREWTTSQVLSDDLVLVAVRQS